MRIVLVTSRVTYVPDNYLHLLRCLARDLGEEAVALVIIDNRTPGLLLSAGGAICAGAVGVGTRLMANTALSFFKTREALFKRVIYTPSINSRACVSALQKINPDLIINLRTRDIYKQAVLETPTMGCINIHHGILPDNRGTMCDLWALHEKRPVGFSVHYMNRNIDDGEILAVEQVDTAGLEDYPRLPYLSSLREAPVLLNVIEKFRRHGPLPGRENRSEAPRFTKNPGVTEIRKIKQAGIQL